MNAVHILENKISIVEKYLKMLEAFEGYSKKEVLSDQMKLSALERQLYLMAQATIDLAEAVISNKKLRKPATYRESFTLLYENKFITAKTLEKMSKMAGFRNLLAHEYIGLDSEKLYDTWAKDLKDVHALLKELKTSLKLK